MMFILDARYEILGTSVYGNVVFTVGYMIILPVCDFNKILTLQIHPLFCHFIHTAVAAVHLIRSTPCIFSFSGD